MAARRFFSWRRRHGKKRRHCRVFRRDDATTPRFRFVRGLLLTRHRSARCGDGGDTDVMEPVPNDGEVRRRERERGRVRGIADDGTDASVQAPAPAAGEHQAARARSGSALCQRADPRCGVRRAGRRVGRSRDAPSPAGRSRATLTSISRGPRLRPIAAGASPGELPAPTAFCGGAPDLIIAVARIHGPMAAGFPLNERWLLRGSGGGERERRRAAGAAGIVQAGRSGGGRFRHEPSRHGDGVP